MKRGYSLIVIVFLVLTPALVMVAVPGTDSVIPVVKEDLVLQDIPEGDAELSNELSPEDVEIPFGGFIENQGQMPSDDVRYFYSTHGYSIGFGTSVIYMRKDAADNSSTYFTITFPGSSDIMPQGVDKKVHLVNYYLGDMQLTGVPTFNEVWYYGIYSGIDLRYHMTDMGLKYDFIVNPGADYADIQVSLNADVSMIVESNRVSATATRNPSVMVYAENGLKVLVEGGAEIASSYRFVDADTNTFGFDIGEYDEDQTLIIDPVTYGYSTYLGGSDSVDYGYAIVVDYAHRAYVVGSTKSDDFPLANPHRDTLIDYQDAFLSVFSGQTLLLSTYFGGNGDDDAYSVDMDGGGGTYIYITGRTQSSDFLLVSTGYRHGYNGNGDAFLMCIYGPDSPNIGQIAYSTCFGGSDSDVGMDIKVDYSDIYLCGSTRSTDFPLADEIDSTLSGTSDAFVAHFHKVNQYDDDDIVLEFSTYYGGSNGDYGQGLDINSYDQLYFVGYTYSDDFATVNPTWGMLEGTVDGFFVRLDLSDYGVDFSSYLGGSDNDFAYDVATVIRANGDPMCFIVGQTYSDDLLTISDYDNTLGGLCDGFIIALVDFGMPMHGVAWWSYIGGSSDDEAHDVIARDEYYVCVTGTTESPDFPLVRAIDYGIGSKEGFVILYHGGSYIYMSTYIGGSGAEYCWGVAFSITNAKRIWLTGSTYSSDFPTHWAYDSTLGGGGDAFIMELRLDSTAPTVLLTFPSDGSVVAPDTTCQLDISDADGVNYVYYYRDYGTSHIGPYYISDPYSFSLPTFDEEFTFEVHAFDYFDNERIMSFDIEIDGSAPVIGLQSPLNDTTQPPGRLIDVSVTDPNLELVRYHWDSEEDSTWSSPYHTSTPDSAGLHNLYIYANDTIGNEILLEYHFNIDDAIPLIELISPAEFGTYYPGTPVDVAVTNVTQEIDTIFYSWDDNPNRSAYPFISIPAGEGWHSVTIYANNTLGLWATDTFTFYVHSTSWLPFSTYLGVGNDDHIESLAIDSLGNIYAAGHTRSTSYPVLNPYQQSHAGYYDGFVTKLGPNGTLLYSTFIGGGSEDRIMDVWVDSEGFCYIVGETRSPDYPMMNEFQNSTDVSVGTNVQSFVTKFNSTGNGLVFSTYIGGIGSGPFGNTYTRGIWADNEGNSYIGGWTGTFTFPSTLTIGPGGMIDAFVAKFDALGNVTYITEVGGGGWEQSEAIIGDNDGNVYFTGHSISPDFPIVNGYDSTYSDNRDVIVAKLNSTGNGLVFSTFLGAENDEIGYSIDIDASRNVYVCGYTDSENFTTYNALQEEFGGDKDWFIAKFNSTGNGLEYSTFYGANWDDYGATDIAVDSSGNAYVTGQVSGLRFHLLNKYQDYGLNYDAVVIKLNSTGNGLLHGTFLGGSSQDFPNGLCILDENSYYVGGYTESSDFPTSNAYDDTFGGNSDCFVTRVAIDEDAPTSMCYQGNNTAHQPSSDVEVEVSDTGIGLSHVMYSWNDEPSSVVVPGAASCLISTSLPENETLHVLHISANDSLNNWYHVVYNLYCDITEPMITLDYPENGILLRSWTEVSISIADLIVDYAEYQWDSSGWSLFNPPYHTDVPVGDGIHTLEVNATDQAGNWFSTIYYFQVDDTTPTIGHPSDISYSEGETGHDLVWSSSDTNLLRYELRRNGSLIQSNYFNHSISDFTFNVDEHTLGTYVYNLTIFDVVGNSVSDITLVVVVDTTHPEIGNPLDVNYEWDSTGNEITWSVFDYYPHSYNITRNGVLIRSGDWDGSDISLNVDDLHAGVYEFRLTVTDEFGLSSSDLVIVTVIDVDNPLISHPIDISYVEDTTGHSITWEVSDDNPEGYIVYRNGTQVDSGQWDGFDIAINIDGLNPGIYNYTLVVTDGSHNQVSDAVTVIVTPTTTGSTGTTTPTETTGTVLPPDSTIMLVLVASIVGVVLIAVIILVLKKRG